MCGTKLSCLFSLLHSGTVNTLIIKAQYFVANASVWVCLFLFNWMQVMNFEQNINRSALRSHAFYWVVSDICPTPGDTKLDDG